MNIRPRKNREDLVGIAAEACSSFFARAHINNKPQSIAQLKHQLQEGAEFSIRSSSKTPIFIEMYFKFKGSSNSIGQSIRKYESFWIKIFSQHFCRIFKISDNEANQMAKTILMIRLGICHQLICEPEPKSKVLIEATKRLNDLQTILIDSVIRKSRDNS